MAFPANPLNVRVELMVSGSWVDITDDVRVSEGITITRGRADEASRVDPGRCSLTLDNRDGKYSPRNPTSPYYGLIGRNTPIRVLVDGEVRFTGEVSSWPPRWDVAGVNAWVPVEASGVLRRLGQGAAVLGSAMYRGRIFDTAGLVAYWPCEDPEGSGSIAPALAHEPMTVIGSPKMAAYEGFAASLPIPLLNGSEWRGVVPPYTSTGRIQVRWLMNIPGSGAPSGETLVLLYTTGSVRRWEVFYQSGGMLGLRAFDGSGDQLFNTGGVAFGVNGKNVMVSVELQQSGNNVDWNLLTVEPGAPSGLQYGGTLTSNTVARVGTVIVSPSGGITDVAIGHISVQNTITSLFDLSWQLAAWDGEAAGRRIRRLCAEEGVPFVAVGDLNDTYPLGPQKPATLLDLLGEAADTDMGVLYEPRHVLGLAYRTRSSMYAQTPAAELDYAAGHLAPPLEPVDDDQAVRNDITVRRSGGSSARAVLDTGPLSVAAPPNGVGRYDEEVTISAYHDLDLANQAYWRLHVGTVDETRYPRLTVNLLAQQIRSDTALMQAVADLDVGDLVTVDNLPSWLPPGRIEQIARGFEERIGPFDWVVSVNCTPGSPYRVAVFGESRYGPVSTVLASAVNATSTTIPITTPSGPLWDPASSGYEIVIGGEVMTVLSVSQASGTNQTLTVVRSVNGVVKPHAAGARVELHRQAVYAL